MSLHRALRLLAVAAVALVAVILGLIVLFRAVPVPVTMVMLINLGDGIDRDWVPLDRISPALPRAVIASEDNRFCQHWGIDPEAFEAAVQAFTAGKQGRGGSTITQQTAKNLFLWTDRSLLRKLLELPLTAALELAWPKRRIIEVYLNIVEWAPGVYGAEAAAQHHFGKPAAKLGRREAALLAAVLPNPRKWSAGKPTGYIRGRAGVIDRRVGQLGPLLDCLPDG